MKGRAIKVLIVDDDPDILEFVSYNLEKEGYEVLSASNGLAAINLAQSENPELIILDIMMPGVDGVEVCRQLREMNQFKNTLIVFLTARNEDYSEIAGFNVGADDYITKPIRPRVLLARIGALFKRNTRAEQEASELNVGDLIIDLSKRMVLKNSEKINLPKKEFDLLSFLASKPGKIFTRNEIYSKIWGNSVHVGDRTLDVHIRRLREKIGDSYIKTSKGIGYGVES